VGGCLSARRQRRATAHRARADDARRPSSLGRSSLRDLHRPPGCASNHRADDSAHRASNGAPNHRATGCPYNRVPVADLRLLLQRERRSRVSVGAPGAACRPDPFRPVTRDAGRKQIIEVMSTARRLRFRVLDLPGSAGAELVIVLEDETLVANVAVAVGLVEDQVQTLGVVGHGSRG